MVMVLTKNLNSDGHKKDIYIVFLYFFSKFLMLDVLEKHLKRKIK